MSDNLTEETALQAIDRTLTEAWQKHFNEMDPLTGRIAAIADDRKSRERCTINWYTDLDEGNLDTPKLKRKIYEGVKLLLSSEGFDEIKLQATTVTTSHYNDVDVSRGMERLLNLKWTGYALIRRTN